MSRDRRCRGDRGMAMVTGLVLLFAFTAGGVIWLARDANRAVSNRTTAQSIAFQAARSGAQRVGVESLRQGAEVLVDEDAARRAAESTAADLFSGYGLDGDVLRVTVVPPDTVEVEVRISDPAGDVTGVAAARAETGR
jgi:Tfp pilus assembly protein PilX